MCKQTFSGHESDINAITVSIHLGAPSIVLIMLYLYSLRQYLTRYNYMKVEND